MKVLVACEESQTVCKAFRERGHEAYSCDIQECSGGHPEWHIRGDVLRLLSSGYYKWNSANYKGTKTVYAIDQFKTCDGVIHQVSKWDLIIAHPPCTYLTAAGAIRLYNKNHSIKDYGRLIEGYNAALFFKQIMQAECDKIAIENPVPMKIFELPPYDQIINPFEYGDPWKKRTCLWLKGLPKLKPTDIVEPIGYWIDAHGHNKAKAGMSKGFRDQKTRSKTFPGIAKAMAEQWG